MIYTWTFFIAFLFAILLSPATIKLSERLNIFSKPKRGEAEGKPCLGGIGIFIACMVACVSAFFLKESYNHKLTGLFISSVLIISLGLIDDAKELRPSEKIIAQLIAVGFLMVFGIFTKILFLPMWMNILITFIWVLFITNAFNLLDIVDGLSSGLVIIISLTLLVISLVNGDVFSSMVLTALIGAHLGFLKL